MKLLDRFIKVQPSFTYADLIQDPTFNYPVHGYPCFVEHPVHGKLSIPFTRANVREDRPWVLGVVGDTYRILQNQEAADITQEMTRDGSANFIAFGAPNHGEQFYILLQTPDFLELGDSKIESLFFLTASHDGSRALEAYPLHHHDQTGLVITPRLRGIKIRHTKNAGVRIAKAKQVISYIREEWTRYQDDFNDMRRGFFSDEDAKGFFATVVEGDSTRAENIRAKFFELYKTGLTSKVSAFQGTVLGAFMAVVEYADQFKTIRKSKHRDEAAAAIHSRLLGDAARQKAQAYAAALKFANLFERDK